MATAADHPAPAYDLASSNTLAITQWLVAGPFPDPKAGTPPDPRFGLEADYLASVGGEARARLTPGLAIPYPDGLGTTRTITVSRLAANPDGIVDLNAQTTMTGSGVAYALAQVRSPSSQVVHCLLGSGDGVKIWVNGKVARTRPIVFVEGSCTPRQDQSTMTLRRGLNTILLKTESHGGDWAFCLELATAAGCRKIQAGLEHEKLIKDFQNAMLMPDAPRRFIIEPGPLPKIVWKDPTLIKKLWGRLPLRVRWFDGDRNEVRTAQKPGRYAAYIEGKTPDGRRVRRAITVFCAAPGDPILKDQNLSTATLRAPTRLISQALWAAWRPELKGLPLARFFNADEALRQEALMLAGLADLTARGVKDLGRWDHTPAIVDQEFHLELKKKILGRDLRAPRPLAPPREVDGPPAPTIRPGTPAEAGVKPETAARLREVCRDWAIQGDAPFTVLVARRGVIVLHEAFGTTTRTVALDQRMSLDSVTKMVSGLFFLRYLDQGLLRLEDPVCKFFPELTAPGARALTLHHCFTHTSGLEGHGAWGGLGNPWLENVIANAQETLHPGERAIYNGMGFDLAGKVMEQVSGKNIFRLMHEEFLDPLGLEGVPLDDLAYTAECNAEELARIGQLMLNRGRYGRLEFFSAKTFEKTIPRTANELFPRIPKSDWQYGLGMMWMRTPDPDAGKGGVPKDALLLGPNVLGHGGLSSTMLRVDLDRELVIAMPRSGSGKELDKHIARFLKTLQQGLE